MATTPMMQQYQEAKAACGDALLLFRMGDFYELFDEDAKTAARVIHLTLTSRDKGENPIPMAGFPHHQLDSYLAKLIAAGYRAAVCEQVEDPKKAKGLVRREVTRIVTPGTVTDDALLDPCQSNFLAAIVEGDTSGLAWVDVSTGQFFATSVPVARLADELARISPAECLLSDDATTTPPVDESVLIARRPPWAFAAKAAQKALTQQFGTKSLEGFGFCDTDTPAVQAAGAILDYLQETQKASLGHIERLVPFHSTASLQLDESTRRSLEITRTIRDGRREGSLLAILDRTVTAMGSRLLSDWIANPLTDIDTINGRLDAVEELLADATFAEACRELLRGVYDLQRLLGRISTGRASPRDLSFIARTLACLPKIKAKLTGRTSPLLRQLEADLDLCPDLRTQLEAALVDDCPLTSREGGLIRDGFSEKLDGYRDLMRGGKQWMAEYQAHEAERIGMPKLKIGFNKVFGYFLEVTNANRDKIPDDYIRKQTLKNAERYITPELKQHEEGVLAADEKSKDLEYELFLELRDAVAASLHRLLATARILAQIDALVSLAELARARGYCRPTMCQEPRLEILDGRHPVLDVTEPDGTFVPNDTTTGADDGLMLLITGPNMAGKSTYIRQVALITIMAQSGSFVPARQATIGIADRVFARVGASDELSRGQSTFMVEMLETARILNTATERSLVILDEIGRGTSTYDGLSLAWSVVEYLHDEIGCRTLFATHYHELTDLEKSLSGVKNLNVAVREWEEQVVFLHKIVDGAADKSYGIHVARLAGVPKSVNERAKAILSRLEEEHLDPRGGAKIARRDEPHTTGDLQLTLFGYEEHPLLEKIRTLAIDQTTPLTALETLQQWQQELASEPQVKPR